MDLQKLAASVAKVAQNAGSHALQNQLNPHSFAELNSAGDRQRYTSDIDHRLQSYCHEKIEQIEPCNGFWDEADVAGASKGERFWCIGNIDGVINYERNLSEWTITVSLFESDGKGEAYPVLGIVHAPALGLTYLAAQGKGAIRIRRMPTGGEKREPVIPSTTPALKNSVVCFGMSYFQDESRRALETVSEMAGLPSDVKRIGPASLDLCKVADGTYDAYFEPSLHSWDVPAVSAGAVVVWEAKGKLHQWDGSMIHWNRANDVVATNGVIDDELMGYLQPRPATA
ncbi:MAG: inositol monophosphatase family protein [Bifidobacteriaceae bacterium]|nr:inositol monophosphatase family protein [Bifidobacteriaceae bacterium]